MSGKLESKEVEIDFERSPLGDAIRDYEKKISDEAEFRKNHPIKAFGRRVKKSIQKISKEFDELMKI